MTTREIIDELSRIMNTLADPGVPSPNDRVVRGYMAADSLKARLVQEELGPVWAEFPGSPPPAGPPEAETWRDRPPLL